MALRYSISLDKSIAPATDLVVAHRMKAPVVVEFRKGADLVEIAKSILDKQSVLLDAAVGSGKSTCFPQAMAQVTRSLVLVVTPNPLLALDLYNYVVKKREADGTVGPPLEMMTEASAELPRTGVVYVGAPVMVGWLLQHRRFPVGREITIVLDEAHESDAYTFVLRTLCVNMGASRLVQMSATMMPAGSRMRETPGLLKKHYYDEEGSVADWDVTDASKPWYYADIRDCMVVFVDSRTQAEALRRSYHTYGISAYRLEARMTEKDFQTAMAAMRDRAGPMVVLLADYSFRSGFTFDTKRIVDTGTVSYYDPAPGVVRRLNRYAYAGELEQAAGRGGRIERGEIDYYCPKSAGATKVCDLEGVEMEAAAFLYRCLGFQPAAEISSTVMASNDLPAHVSARAALNGVYPLSYYVVNSKGQLRVPSPAPASDVDVRSDRRVRFSVDSSSGHSDTSGSVDVDTPCTQPDDTDEYFEREHKTLPQGRTAELGMDALRLLGDALCPAGAKELKLGDYYSVAGVTGRAVVNMPGYFPRGLETVKMMMSREGGSAWWRQLPDAARDAAIGLVLTRYNSLNAEIEGFLVALNRSAKKLRSGRVHTWSRESVASQVEVMNGYVAERGEIFWMLQDMTSARYYIDVGDVPSAAIEKRAQYFEDYFDRLVVQSFQPSVDLETVNDGCVRALADRDKSGKRIEYSVPVRDGEVIASIRTPGWMGYKRLQVSREMVRDEHGNVLDEWTRFKYKRSSWNKRLNGSGSDRYDYGRDGDY